MQCYNCQREIETSIRIHVYDDKTLDEVIDVCDECEGSVLDNDEGIGADVVSRPIAPTLEIKQFNNMLDHKSAVGISMSKGELVRLLWTLHFYKNGVLFMSHSRRKRGSGDPFVYKHNIFGECKLHPNIAAQLVANGYCDIITLDADTEYLATTPSGREALERLR